MKPTKKRYIAYMLPLLLCLLLLVPTSASASVPVEQVPTGYKVVRTEKLDELKSNNDKLALKLAELEQKLALLKMPSDELIEQLAIARNELHLCKQELKSAKNSLESAKALQEQTQKSLQSLEKMIDAERQSNAKTQNRLRRQRTFWAICAGFFAAVSITK